MTKLVIIQKHTKEMKVRIKWGRFNLLSHIDTAHLSEVAEACTGEVSKELES